MLGGIIGVGRKRRPKGPPRISILAAPVGLGSAFLSYGYPVAEPIARVNVDFTIRNWFYYS
ncbi:hypothetical protein BVIET440_260002 [Burkholderia vietnamiensis]|nr:hypothetical protein BVI434_1200015 [Burkholderia vietnamiensis]CAG9200958.1 hypothetical protein BVI2075_300015 [Burkholderia vietnamiensis]CAG9208259.1 hypothetical protein BVI1335_20014 [Burkholderia vietnamiensis]